MNPTRAEIDFTKLAYNLDHIKKHLQRKSLHKRIKICGVVKANAYGHGIEDVSRALVDLGTDYLGVANYDEAMRLRKLNPDIPILVFGTLIHSKIEPEKYVSVLLKYDLIATVASLDTARFLDHYSSMLRKKFRVHIKVDTGMKRIGFDVKRAYQNILQVLSLKNVLVEGIYTHFATSEAKNKSFAYNQLNKFFDLLEKLRKDGIEFPLVHAANSGAILDIEESYFDMVRPGMILYGYYPSNDVKNKIELKPIMNFKSRVMYIKKVEARTSISYGRTYYTKRPTFIGSIPVGYGDGYWRILSNRSKVLINGKFYPVVGTITMDWLMIDLGQKPSVRVGDDVLLMGQENGINLGADKLSRIAGTIPYETVCAVADRVNRIYFNK
ncbi:MAG: alanine racemase [Ignavibacteria bacterium]|jgi:alanine racemase